MAILVTGGAGYIGSFIVADLIEAGEKVVVLDNLARGHRQAIHPKAEFYKGDMGDQVLLRQILSEHPIESCFHFSAWAEVNESVQEPLKYYQNNFSQTISLLQVLQEAQVRQIVFSSTCAVYGEPKYMPLDEVHPQNPTSPYGWSKLMVEQALKDQSSIPHGLKFVALRYFNACGASADLGEAHTRESHLIPLVIQAAMGTRESITLFGDDYPTPDGTPVRDYIHVKDLSRAHILALAYLKRGGASGAFNLGSGKGNSVKEVVEAVRKVSGKEIKTVLGPRRAGDPSHLVANTTRTKSELGWEPQADLLQIVQSAWDWHSCHPQGYSP